VFEMGGNIKFGTDGWRAVIAEDYTFDNVRICAQALASHLKREGAPGKRVVVGYDTRFASEDFAAATAEVLGANGIHVYLSTSALPTPAVSHAVLGLKADAGVVITASHNPAQWNGFKIKGPDGSSAPPSLVTQVETEIAALTASTTPAAPQRRALHELTDSGMVEWYDLIPSYLDALRERVDTAGLSAMRGSVAFDPMFGAGAGLPQRLLDGGQLRLTEINAERNPAFPGIRPEPIAPNLDKLCRLVRETGALTGIATDGDADRVGIVDEQGDFLNQHQVFALLSYYLLEVRGERGHIIRSITTSDMISLLGQHYGVPVHVTPVGFKYIAPLMHEYDALIGGEESGGYAFRGHVPDRDGILAGLFFLDMVRQTGKSPSVLLQGLYRLVGPHYYDRLDLELEAGVSARLTEVLKSLKPDAVGGLQVEEVDRTDGVVLRLKGGSWLLYRLSGTEPLLRIYVETDTPGRVHELLAAGRALLELPG